MRPHRQRRGGGLDLCGSMPITIIEMGPFAGEPTAERRGRHSDFQLGGDHASVESDHGRRRARPQTPGEPAQDGRQEGHERSRARHLRQATTSDHPVRQTGRPIQVGNSSSFPERHCRRSSAPRRPGCLHSQGGSQVVISSRLGLVPARPMVRRASHPTTRGGSVETVRMAARTTCPAPRSPSPAAGDRVVAGLVVPPRPPADHCWPSRNRDTPHTKQGGVHPPCLAELRADLAEQKFGRANSTFAADMSSWSLESDRARIQVKMCCYCRAERHKVPI